MPTNLRLDLAYILQDDVITDFLPSFGRKQWQVVYGSRDEDPDTFGIFCALLPSGQLAAARLVCRPAVRAGPTLASASLARSHPEPRRLHLPLLWSDSVADPSQPRRHPQI